MKYFKLFIVLSLVLIFASCEKKADISSPLSYDENMVSFSYPGNWKITENEETSELRYIFIESPGDAIVIIQIYALSPDRSLKDYVEWFSDMARQETPVAERTKGLYSNINTKINGIAATGLRETFSVKLLGQVIPHTSEYYQLINNKKVIYIISQSADKDLEKVQSGFQLILKSFLIE